MLHLTFHLGDNSNAIKASGIFGKKAQIKSFGSLLLYEVNQGEIKFGECIDEQLLKLGIKDTDIDAALITHLDCDHANGLKQVKNAKKFLVSTDEVKFANKLTNKVRYYKGWWDDINLTEFEWIREQSLDKNCVESLANNDPDIVPHVIEL